jgi:antitoxin HicB
MVDYPIAMVPDDNGTVMVTFPDFPEAATFGDDRDEAIARAADALETVIEAYIRDRRRIPTPSAGSETVRLSPLVAAKVQIYNAMQRQQVNKSMLAKRLNVHLPQVDRLLDLKHGSKIDQLDAAARALGGQIDVVFVVPDALDVATLRDVVAASSSQVALARHRGRRASKDAPIPPAHAGVLKRAKPQRAAAAKKK